MARSARTGDEDDGEDDAAAGEPAPAISFPPGFVEALATAISQAIAAGIATAAPSLSGAPAARKISAAISPYHTETIDLDTKEGKNHWQMVTAKEEGWKPLPLTTDSAEAFANLFKDRAAQFGLDPILDVPTKGSGAPHANPRVVAGVEYWNADLTDPVNIITENHNVSIEQVQNFSAWIMSGESATLGPPDPDNMVVVAVDPNKTGNVGLVNKRKVLLRQYVGILNMILKNHLTRAGFVSLNPKSDLFKYRDETTGRVVECGLIKLKLVLELINPNLVVDYALKERELESLTLAKCGNDVHDYLSKIQEKRSEINSNLPGKEEYPVRRFVTNMFEQLEKSTCTDFLANVKESKSKWIVNERAFNLTDEIAGLIKLFVNYSAKDTWGKAPADPKVLALTTELLKEKRKYATLKKAGTNKKTKKTPQEKNTGRNSLDPWRFTHAGKLKTVDGVKYIWCPHHGHKDEDGKQSGMYMHDPHDHEDWLKQREDRAAAWKAGKKTAGEKKSGGGGNTKSTDKKLVLAKSMQSILATKAGFSDEEAKHLVESAEKQAAGKD